MKPGTSSSVLSRQGLVVAWSLTASLTAVEWCELSSPVSLFPAAMVVVSQLLPPASSISALLTSIKSATLGLDWMFFCAQLRATAVMSGPTNNIEEICNKRDQHQHLAQEKKTRRNVKNKNQSTKT
jgi:hypothetical protein